MKKLLLFTILALGAGQATAYIPLSPPPPGGPTPGPIGIPSSKVSCYQKCLSTLQPAQTVYSPNGVSSGAVLDVPATCRYRCGIVYPL